VQVLPGGDAQLQMLSLALSLARLAVN